MNRLQRIASELQAAGFPVLKIVWSEEPECEDDDIVISDTISVQVGPDYIGVVTDDKNPDLKERTWTFSPLVDTVAELTSYLTTALKEK